MKTYHIITVGCQMNKSDSERVAGLLEKNGYKKTHDKYWADLVVVNTCGVRQSAEDRIYGLIPRIKKENPKAKIILTGCLVERKDVKCRLNKYVDTWLPITKIPLAPFIKREKCDNYLIIKPNYESKISAYVPIGNGCDNYCSYCVVPYARGREVYRPAKDILDEVKSLIKNGYKEITLIAQNVNSYKSGKIDFPSLLKMVNDLKGDFWIRFSTSHPKDMSGKLIRTMAKCEKVCHQVHLPVQAGDDAVLKMMNRKYTIKHYIGLIKKIRQAMPDVGITTDIIVGFPGETKKQFNNSAKLMRQVKFDMAYIARYSPRFGTAAAKLKDDVTKAEKKRREEELTNILRKTALENNKRYIGKSVAVLVESRNMAGEWIGKTMIGKNVKFPMTNDKLFGKFIKVKITKTKNFSMGGRIIK